MSFKTNFNEIAEAKEELAKAFESTKFDLMKQGFEFKDEDFKPSSEDVDYVKSNSCWKWARSRTISELHIHEYVDFGQYIYRRKGNEIERIDITKADKCNLMESILHKDMYGSPEVLKIVEAYNIATEIDYINQGVNELRDKFEALCNKSTERLKELKERTQLRVVNDSLIIQNWEKEDVEK